MLAGLVAVGAHAETVPVPQLPPEVRLGDAPQAPAPGEIPLSGAFVLPPPADGYSINTQDREAVRVFYRGLYSQTVGVPMGWTGGYTGCNAGTTSQAFQNAVALRINWYRALAGVPARVILDATFSDKAQDAALMMSANNSLSHFPPSNWSCYTADGSEAASKSNLAIGNTGPDAVTSFMIDNGTNNTAVGHRRWILYPQTVEMGSGDVPGGQSAGIGTVSSANALWVFDSRFSNPRPATRDTFVAWPPKGYVPYQFVVGRWSFSYPGANFANATVTMNPGGPVAVEPVATGFGENTIVWLPQSFGSLTAWPKPGADQSVTVTVNNVSINGTPQSFTYSVVIFDPDVPTPGTPVPVAIPPATATAQVPFPVAVQAMANATGYEVNLYRATALTGTLTAANSASSWTANVSSGYAAIGAAEFNLRHSEFRDQLLSFTKELYVGTNANVAFDSRFGFATTTEFGKVQVSLDGSSWQDVFSQAGTNSPTSIVRQSINLQAFAGKVIRLRFAFVATGSFYPNGDNIGWYFNNIAFTNTSEISLVNWVTLGAGGGSQNLTALSEGTHVLAARAQYQGSYFTDWGSGIVLQVTPPDNVAPTVPQTFSAMVVSETRIDLSWSTATDAVGVTQYKLYRSTDDYAVPIAILNASQTTYSDTGLGSATTYSYKVAACDAAGNCSAPSSSATARTLLSAGQIFSIIQMILDD